MPGKNLAEIGGRPCVAWTIEHALHAVEIDTVLVSSDSDVILDIATTMGAAVHRRSAVLATDTARVDDVLREAVVWFEGQQCEHGSTGVGAVGGIALLYGNVPVRPAGLLDRAVALWRTAGCDSVQSYVRVGKHHPMWQVRIGEDGAVVPWQGDRLFNGVYRRQELPASFVPDGGVLVTSRAALFGELPGAAPEHPHSFLGNDHRGVMTDEGEVIDIDTAADLAVAEATLARSGGTIAVGG